MSYGTYIGLVPPPGVFRPFGISALTVARNEEDWIDISVKSIVDYVDEILLVDNKSEDGTAAKMREIVAAFPEKARLISIEEEDFVAVNNSVLKKTKYRWILRWHADFIARTSGAESLKRLARHLRELDPLRYFCIPISGVALDGDLTHQFPDRRDSFEPLLFTYSPWLRFRSRGLWESLHVPWFYEKQYWKEASHFHMRTVKSSRRMIQRLYWSRWFESRTNGARDSLQDFIRTHALEDFRCGTLEEAAHQYVIREFKGVVPYERSVCGDYPYALMSMLPNPPFQLIYDNGRLVNRIERPRLGSVREVER